MRRLLALIPITAMLMITLAPVAEAEAPYDNVSITVCKDVYIVDSGGGSRLVLEEDTPGAIEDGLSTQTAGVFVYFDSNGDGQHERYIAEQTCPEVQVRSQTRQFDWDDIDNTNPNTQSEYDRYYDQVRNSYNAGITDCDAHHEGRQTDCYIPSRSASNVIRIPVIMCSRDRFTHRCNDGTNTDNAHHYWECPAGTKAVRGSDQHGADDSCVPN